MNVERKKNCKHLWLQIITEGNFKLTSDMQYRTWEIFPCLPSGSNSSRATEHMFVCI